MADIRCIAGGMVPARTIPTTIQSKSLRKIQRYRVKQLYAQVTIPSTIPDQLLTQPWWFWVTPLQCRNRIWWSHTRLVFGVATIPKKGDEFAGNRTTPTANYLSGSAPRHTAKCIHQSRTLSAASAHGEEPYNCALRTVKVHLEKLRQGHLQMNQEVACPRYNHEIHSCYWNINFWFTPSESIWHP